MALASYQRGLLAANSPFDRWYYGEHEDALNASAIRGWALFREKGCSSCHTVESDHAHFTDGNYYDTGVGFARSMKRSDDPDPVRLAPGISIVPTVDFPQPQRNDLGRYEVTGAPGDRWRYRVPTLRNVALTAPYMHDGSLPDLASVIDYYDRGGVPHEGQDPRIRPLHLEPQEKTDLVAFLKSLNASNSESLAEDGRSQAIGDSLHPQNASKAQLPGSH